MFQVLKGQDDSSFNYKSNFIVNIIDIYILLQVEIQSLFYVFYNMRCVKHFSVPRTNFKKDYLKSPLREKPSNFINM